VGLLLGACGAKTGVDAHAEPDRLEPGDPYEDPLGDPCSNPDQCATLDRCNPRACVGGVCVEDNPIVCDDSDPCTRDSCAPATGECDFSPLTPDEDGDGIRAPLPGFEPGAPGSCGADCDDQNADALPGAAELCDGVDNDCNGVVDDGYAYEPSMAPPVLLSMGEEGGLGGISYADDQFVVSLSYNVDHQQSQLVGVGASGEIGFAQDVALTNSDSYAGPLVWTGRVFASAWEDRRNEDYEIYFNRFDAAGNKLGPDIRLSASPDFSLNPDVVFTGSDYLVAWGDRRDGTFRIYGQLLDSDGVIKGDINPLLTPDLGGAESPSLARGTDNFGLVFNSQSDGKRVVFRTVSSDLESLGQLVTLSEPGTSGAGVSFSDGRYIVTWGEYSDGPGDAVWGAVLDDRDGSVMVAPKVLTGSTQFVRSHSLLDFGDRFMLLWAQWVDDTYDIYTRFLDHDLEPISEPERLTVTAGSAVSPTAAFSSDGTIGVAFLNVSNGSPQVYFTTLVCR